MDQFQRPYLLLLMFPILILYFYQWKQNPYGPIFFIKSDRFQKLNSTLGIQFRRILYSFTEFLVYLSMVFLVIAAAGPGSKYKLSPDSTKGVDIMIALDISGSMVNSYDFLPRNRLSVSKDLLREFIKKRLYDRIGIVVFAGAAYLQSPLSSDRFALDELIAGTSSEDIEEQGTAVGDALVLSSYRLKNSEAKSKVIILLTDGVSNTGKLDPDTAAYTTKTMGIKVYCIGIGKEEGQYEINYESLQKISSNTNGKFFRAESPEVLESVLNEIDQLEVVELPSKPLEIQETQFPVFVFFTFISLILYLLLKIYPLKEKI
ncbi:VWA domain-containing protein BatA [Leptospira biflexa]|uniref:VWA domain-containing protein BatA n=1 Tax=Leptospira biflexa TaxID=172 RepID=UPI0010839E00|nr:VWA domain-containing protein [Leptospira biflexa]TGM32056.1 VWA domain-containing protein [Leptospira biflexa]TGM42034.1 VWA domain-containing protein [Leptospira biflexa]TGM51708.1 VWA domain-containing protein [Leptospira biflexa]